jgi:hypothetical protein
MLRAALLDVGGTLWPDHVTPPVSAHPCLELALQDTHGLLGRTLGILGANATG